MSPTQTAEARYVPNIGCLTLDDLEALAFRYGGTIERGYRNTYRLVGALIDGRVVTVGPVTM